MLEKQIWQMPLAAGLNTRVDKRALPAPSLAICRNAQFDEMGGIQTRKPFGAMATAIVGGGTLPAVRTVAVNGDELLAFTQENLYAFSQRDQGWVNKGLHLAAKTTEESAFSRTADQVFADVAELSGVRAVIWHELPGSGGATQDVYIAATDAVTGAVILPPTVLAAGGKNARIVPLATKFLVVVANTSGQLFEAGPVDPANLATSVAAFAASSSRFTLTTALTATGIYDLVAGFGVGWAGINRGDGTYDIHRVTDAITSGTTTTVNKGDIATRIAVAFRPDDGSQLMVARFDNTVIRADHLNATTLATLAGNTSVATPSSTTVNQITACFSTVLDSEARFRCFIFWSCGETTASPAVPATADAYRCQSSWVNTGATVGILRTVVRRMGLASRAFPYNGRVLIWLAFAGVNDVSASGTAVTALGFRAALQNGYYLYRDIHGMGPTPELADFMGSPYAKALPDRAGGLTAVAGVLPGVQAIDGDSGFLWAAIERRIIQLGAKQTGYAARSPRLVYLALDSNEARRCARLGRTTYVAGSLVMQYDGVGLTEVGIHVVPWSWTYTIAGGALAAGAYVHKLTMSWPNAVGEKERSTAVIASSGTIVASRQFQFVNGTPFLYVTHKKGLRAAPALEYWRTQVNPVQESPFHLVSSIDPADSTNPNRYVANDVTAIEAPFFNDDMLDADLVTKEAYYENGGELENLPPPPCSMVIATQDRLVVAGLAEDPNAVAYTKQRQDGQIAAFHPNLRITLPPDGGPVTALALLSDTIIVFKERAIYALPGEGFDNTGGGFNYGPPQTVSLDIGAVSMESVATVPQGVVFKSSKGWHLLSESMDVQYIGAPTYAFDGDTVRGVTVLESQHQIRFVTDSRILVWDYLASQWSEWPVVGTGGLSSTLWLGQHVIVSAAAIPRRQATTFDGSETAYGLDLETGWISFDDVRQSDLRVWRIMPIGEYRSAHRLQIRLARDYQESDASGPTYFQTKHWAVSPTTVGGPLQVKHSPSIQRCQAMKLRITAKDAALDQAPAGEALKLTAVAFEFGVERHLVRRIAAVQRQ